MSIRRHLSFVALTLALVSATSGASAQSSWRFVRLEAVGTSCRMPGPHRVVRSRAPNAQGFMIDYTTAVAETPVGAFAVMVTTLEGGAVVTPRAIADAIADTLQSQTQLGGASPSRERRLSLPGFYADEQRYELGETVAIVRRAVGRERAYVALALVPIARLDTAERFVRAVRVDRDDALFPMGDETGAAAWGEIYLPQEGLAVRMPAPSRDTLGRSPVGGARAHLLEARDHVARYRVLAIARDPATSFDAVVTAAHLEGEARPIHVNGYPGRELVAPDGRRARVLRGADHWFVFEVTPTEPTAAPRADAFFDSIHLL